MLENIAFESRGTVAVWSSKHSLLQIISSAWGTRGVSFEERSMRNYLETENVEKFHMRFSRPPPQEVILMLYECMALNILFIIIRKVQKHVGMPLSLTFL